MEAFNLQITQLIPHKTSHFIAKCSVFFLWQVEKGNLIRTALHCELTHPSSDSGGDVDTLHTFGNDVDDGDADADSDGGDGGYDGNIGDDDDIGDGDDDDDDDGDDEYGGDGGDDGDVDSNGQLWCW